MQTVCQRLEQPEETKKGCSPGSDVNSVVHQLCEVTNCGEAYSEHMKGVSLQAKGRLKQHFEFWQKSVHRISYVLTVIREGCRLPVYAVTSV